MWLLRKPICDWLGFSFLGFSFYLLFNHKQPSKSFMIQSIFLLLNLPKPLNIKPYSRTFKYLIKNPYLVGTAYVHQNDYSLTLYFPQEPYSPRAWTSYQGIDRDLWVFCKSCNLLLPHLLFPLVPPLVSLHEGMECPPWGTTWESCIMAYMPLVITIFPSFLRLCMRYLLMWILELDLV